MTEREEQTLHLIINHCNAIEVCVFIAGRQHRRVFKQSDGNGCSVIESANSG